MNMQKKYNDNFPEKIALGQIDKNFKNVLFSQPVFHWTFSCSWLWWMNVISCELILPMYFDIRAFERHLGLS